MKPTIWRLHAYDAMCTTHGTHDFEAREALFEPNADSDTMRAQVKKRMHDAFGCNITDFGCYVATPIFNYALG